MIIRCPHCAFSRQVDEDKIPAAAQTATCPKCEHKFRFREAEAAVGGVNEENAEGDGLVFGQVESEGGNKAVSGSGAPGGRLVDPDSEKGEDIWDRVASLGEHWADDNATPDRSEDLLRARGAGWTDEQARASAIPWEHIRDLGLLKAFIQTALRSVLRAGRFFSHLGAPGALGPAVVFYMAITALQTYLFQVWLQIFPSALFEFGLPFDQALYDSSRPLYVMLAAPVFWLSFFAVTAVLSAMLLRFITGSNSSPSAVMRIMAYASTPMLLGIIPFIGAVLGQVGAMFLFLFGCKQAFRIKLFIVLIVLLPVYFCLAMLRIILSGSF